MGAARRLSAEDEYDVALEAEVTSILAAYEGDARAAIRALVVENAALENQIEHAVGGISAGYVRAKLRASVR